MNRTCRLSNKGSSILRALESYQHLASTVGPRRARQLSRAELVTRIARRLAGPGWASVQSPSLDQLLDSMPVADAVPAVLAWAGLDAASSEKLQAEYSVVDHELASAYVRASLSCPAEWAVEASTSMILFCLVRHLRPSQVVETGIANGHSAFVILSALRANGSGELASIDVRHDVGALVPQDLATRWTKVIIDDQRPGLDVLEHRLGDRRPIDLFFHDGDHRFLGQMLDYALARRMLSPEGILVSDDINTTAAWIDAHRAGDLGEDALMLLDRRKAVGFARPSRIAGSGLVSGARQNGG